MTVTDADADADAAVMRAIAAATVHVENESVQLRLDAMVQLVALNPSFLLVEGLRDSIPFGLTLSKSSSTYHSTYHTTPRTIPRTTHPPVSIEAIAEKQGRFDSR